MESKTGIKDVKLHVENKNTRRSNRWYWRSEANRKKHADRISKMRLTRSRNGLCFSCGQPNTAKTRNCEACSKKKAELQKQIRTERILENLCVRCGLEHTALTANCGRCKEILRAYSRRRRIKNASRTNRINS